MSVSAGAKLPPPPYREPLPGSQFTALARPSVITQAPKREPKSDRENKDHLKKIVNLEASAGRETERFGRQGTVHSCRFAFSAPESISMVDPVIDEHFRRSLGADYMNLFVKNKDAASKTPSHSPPHEPMSPTTPAPVKQGKPDPQTDTKSSTNGTEVGQEIEMSVDDHFAKALGDRWKQYLPDEYRQKGEIDVGHSS